MSKQSADFDARIQSLTGRIIEGIETMSTPTVKPDTEKPLRRLPDKIRVVQRNTRDSKEFCVEIDGEEFPYHISDKPGLIVGPVSHGECPSITVTILARCVEVTHEF